MIRVPRSFVASTVVVALVFWALPAPAVAAAGDPARLEGQVVGIDGRPAEGFQIHLIGSDGTEVAAVETDDDGIYSFERVEAGRYGLGVGNPQGQVAPVAAPPIDLDDGQLARRDLRLVQTDEPRRQELAGINPSVGSWWAGLSTPAKAWVVVAIVVAAWFTYEALTDDSNDQEQPASPM
jgi:hypothetical protein